MNDLIGALIGLAAGGAGVGMAMAWDALVIRLDWKGWNLG